MAPTVVTRTSRSKISETKEFTFSRQDLLSLVNGLPEISRVYREQAWDTFIQLPFPKPTDEPWRRTDLRRLDTDGFRLPKPGEFEDLPVIPDDLLQPLVGEQHGGQITLLPGGSHVELNQELE
jgi:hypothetical protein